MAHRLDGFSADAREFAQLDFALDFSDGLRRNVHELHTDTHTGQTIAHFAARANFRAGERETEAQIEHRTFGKPRGRIEEHSVSAHVGGSNGDLFGAAFIVNGDFLYRMDARAEPYPVPLRLMIIGFH